MADEKATNQNQGNEQREGKAMGAAANAGNQSDLEPGNATSEIAGQGGGIQGTGQGQQNPGGFTSGQDQSRDEGRSEGSTRQPDPTQGE